MGKPIAGRNLPREVRTLLQKTKAANSEEAIRVIARQILADFLGTFPDEGPAINVEALASFRSIRLTNESPSFSEDAELVPSDDGRVRMRINRDRPITRQRFSIGHDVG